MKPSPVIAVQSPFRSGPDVPGAILRQGEDGQVLQPIGGPIMAEAVLLGKASSSRHQIEYDPQTEAMTPTHLQSYTSHIGLDLILCEGA